MENFTLNTLVDYARSKGFKKIIGEYLPTAKNAMVKEHYPNLGFTQLGSGTDMYQLDVEGYQKRQCYIIKKN